MKNQSKITQADLRHINRAAILNAFRDRGTLSKQELADILQISHTTVNTHIQALTEEGLVARAGEGVSIGGKKPLLFQLAKHARYAFGVYIAPERATILLTNMLGEVEAREMLTYPPAMPFSQILGQVGESITGMIAKNSLPTEKILGVGMSVPGAVDVDKNLIVFAPNIGVRNYNVEPFAQTLGLRVFAENEAITATYAEQFLGRGKGEAELCLHLRGQGDWVRHCTRWPGLQEHKNERRRVWAH